MWSSSVAALPVPSRRMISPGQATGSRCWTARGRIKPCGGAIPPCCIREFQIPDSQIVARIRSARMVAPSAVGVDMPIENGFVGMVDREHFDEFLRERAALAGATRISGTFENLRRNAEGRPVIDYRPKADTAASKRSPGGW